MSLDTNVISKTLRALIGDFCAEYGDTYDSIVMIDGTKPSEADFTAKYNELIALEPISLLREQRDIMLKETDWMAGQDRTMSQAEKDYRQALRDITDTYSDLDTVVWPTKP